MHTHARHCSTDARGCRLLLRCIKLKRERKKKRQRPKATRELETSLAPISVCLRLFRSSGCKFRNWTANRLPYSLIVIEKWRNACLQYGFSISDSLGTCYREKEKRARSGNVVFNDSVADKFDKCTHASHARLFRRVRHKKRRL